MCEKKAQAKIQQAINQLKDELFQDIRYPYDYHFMDTPKGHEILSEVSKKLTSECPDCQTIHLNEGSQSEFNRLFPLIKQQKHSCLKEIITNMVEQLTHYSLPETCQTNKTHPLCKNMFKNRHLFLDRLHRLTELVYGESARLQTEMRFCSDCPQIYKKKGTVEPDLKSIENVWQQSSNCQDLQHGK